MLGPLPTSHEMQCGPAGCLSDRALAGVGLSSDLDYRCGAVPGFHRIPFQASSRGTRRARNVVVTRVPVKARSRVARVVE